ncbi:dTMP kinase [bacterium]|nr:dTMP kinase [bacterium]MBQ6435936.1 dTMP kinase [bacterium]
MTGTLISFEGIDGAGKTTQVQLLKKKLEAQGCQVVLTREPGGTYVAEQIRTILLDPQNKGMDDLTEVLLYQAARAQVYEEIVLPALKKGAVVIMDRSLDSSVVYQGIARGMGQTLIEKLNEISTRGVKPDITFLLDIPVKVSKKRREGETPDRLEAEKQAFHEKVRAGYLKLFEQDKGGRIKKIEATKTVEEVEREIADLLDKCMTGCRLKK